MPADQCPTCGSPSREIRGSITTDGGFGGGHSMPCHNPWHDATPTLPVPAPGEVVLRMNGRARSCLVANSDGKFYDSEAWDALPKGDTVYVAVPAAQRERDSAERDRRRCLDEIKRVYEAVGIDPFRDPITTCAADVKKMYAAATARADKAEALVAAAANATSVHADLVALLREARPYLVNQGPFDERERSHLVRRIDAQLERKA